jgi:hypothetical protein
MCALACIKLSNRLTRNKTTHLICREDGAVSEKCEHARTWGSVRLVTAGWVFESVRCGERQAEDAFSTPGRLLQQLVPICEQGGGDAQCAPVAPPSAAVDSDDGLHVGVRCAIAHKPQQASKLPMNEPDDVLDVVARPTSAVKQTGKRWATHIGVAHVHSVRLFQSNPMLLPGAQTSTASLIQA